MKTPQQSIPPLAKMLGIPELYLKREDLHPYGSHKGRSIPFMIKSAAKHGVTSFVMSSSGNAALAAIRSIEKHNQNNPHKQLTLKIFIGLNIDPTKEKLIHEWSSCCPAITVEKVERPKQAAFQLDQTEGARFLRQSTDDTALDGYIELAKEIEKIPDLAAVFVPTSSGTAAQALATYFAEQIVTPQVHIVQGEACHPIAEAFDADFEKKESSVAGALVDLVAHRKVAVIESVQKTKGHGWVVNDDLILEAQKLLKEYKVDVTPNGAVALAGLLKALRSGRQIHGPVVCIIGGK